MKSLLPESDRILLGPGPSLTSPRVMRAMAAPTVGHLDPLMIAMLDDVRAKLTRLFRAPDNSFAFAVSGTGTSGMETAVANTVKAGSKVTVVVNGYFGDRLAQMAERYGATVTRVNGEWGRAADPAALEKSWRSTGAEIVAMVQGETSTGVLNPVRELAAIARTHDALTIVDAVTSFGGVPLDVAGWGIDVCYSCTQKCLGAPSGLAPIVFAPRALERLVKCPSFYFDLSLLRDYWLNRKYHHTMSSALVCALYEALTMIEEEGLEARWTRHERNHRAFVDGPGGDGPLAPAARIRSAVDPQHRPHPGRRGRRGRAETAARGVQHRDRRRPRPAGRQDLARRPDGHELGVRVSSSCCSAPCRPRWPNVGSTPKRPPARRPPVASRGGVAGEVRRARHRGLSAAVLFAGCAYAYLTLPDVRPLARSNPSATAFMTLRAAGSARAGAGATASPAWVPLNHISPDLRRAVLIAEDDAFFQHEGVDFEQLRLSLAGRLGARPLRRAAPARSRSSSPRTCTCRRRRTRCGSFASS